MSDPVVDAFDPDAQSKHEQYLRDGTYQRDSLKRAQAQSMAAAGIIRDSGSLGQLQRQAATPDQVKMQPRAGLKPAPQPPAPRPAVPRAVDVMSEAFTGQKASAMPTAPLRPKAPPAGEVIAAPKKPGESMGGYRSRLQYERADPQEKKLVDNTTAVVKAAAKTLLADPIANAAALGLRATKGQKAAGSFLREYYDASGGSDAPGAFSRAAGDAVVPTGAGLVGAGAAARAAAPFAAKMGPVGGVVVEGVAGTLGALGFGHVGQLVQNKALELMLGPEGYKEFLWERQTDSLKQPGAVRAGGLAPMVATMQPNISIGALKSTGQVVKDVAQKGLRAGLSGDAARTVGGDLLGRTLGAGIPTAINTAVEWNSGNGKGVDYNHALQDFGLFMLGKPNAAGEAIAGMGHPMGDAAGRLGMRVAEGARITREPVRTPLQGAQAMETVRRANRVMKPLGESPDAPPPGPAAARAGISGFVKPAKEAMPSGKESVPVEPAIPETVTEPDSATATPNSATATPSQSTGSPIADLLNDFGDAGTRLAIGKVGGQTYASNSYLILPTEPALHDFLASKEGQPLREGGGNVEASELRVEAKDIGRNFPWMEEPKYLEPVAISRDLDRVITEDADGNRRLFSLKYFEAAQRRGLKLATGKNASEITPAGLMDAQGKMRGALMPVGKGRDALWDAPLDEVLSSGRGFARPEGSSLRPGEEETAPPGNIPREIVPGEGGDPQRPVLTHIGLTDRPKMAAALADAFQLDPQIADDLAVTIDSFSRGLGKKLGMSPEEVYQRYVAGVTRGDAQMGRDLGGDGTEHGATYAARNLNPKAGDVRNVVAFLTKSGIETPIHEIGHLALNMLSDAARQSPAIMEDIRAVQKWAMGDHDTPLSEDGHEKFAGAFERFMTQGIAPNNSLKAAFQRIRDVAREIYAKLTERGKLPGTFNLDVMRRLSTYFEEVHDDPSSNGYAGHPPTVPPSHDQGGGGSRLGADSAQRATNEGAGEPRPSDPGEPNPATGRTEAPGRPKPESTGSDAGSKTVAGPEPPSSTGESASSNSTGESSPESPSAKLLKIDNQQALAKEIGAEDWTERGELKRTFEDRFKAAAEHYDAFAQMVREKAKSDKPGTLSDEERIVAASLQQDARQTIREVLDKPQRTPEDDASLALAMADATAMGRLLTHTASEAGRALGFGRALMDDSPGGFMKAVERASSATEGKLSLQAQRELAELARQGEKLQEQAEAKRSAAADVEIDKFQSSTPARRSRRIPARSSEASSNPKSAKYGTENTVFTRERYEAAKQKIAASATRMNAIVPGVIDPHIAQALLDIGGFHFEAGLRKFTEWAKQVKADIGQDIGDAHLQSAWLDVKAEAAEKQAGSRNNLPPKPSTFVDILESRLGRKGALNFLEDIKSADGEPELLQKLIDGTPGTPEERKQIADAYRANSPKRGGGVKTPETARLSDILTEFRQKSGYKPKPLTDAEARARTDAKLKAMEATGKPSAFKPRPVNPLISTATMEYAKGARSLDAWGKAMERRIGEALPEATKTDLFRDAVRQFAKENRPVDQIRQQLARRIDEEILKTQSPLIQAYRRSIQNGQKLLTLKATFDNSFFGRQGGKIVTSRPDIGAKALRELALARKTHGSMAEFAHDVDARIKAAAGEYGDPEHFKNIGLEFTGGGGEEGTGGVNLDGPLWTRLKNLGIDASEEGNRAILNYMRLEYFKTLAPANAPIWYQQEMANLVNIMGSRGMVRSESISQLVKFLPKLAVWSPRGRLSNVQWALGSDMAATALKAVTVPKSDPQYAQKRAAYKKALSRQIGERVRYHGTLAMVLAMAGAIANSELNKDKKLQVELDPRSPDRGKIRYGMTEFDTLSGARTALGLLVDLLGVRQLSSFSATPPVPGKEKSWAPPARGQTLTNYYRGSLNPLAGKLVDIWTGSDFKGEPVKVAGLQNDKPFFSTKEAAYHAASMAVPMMAGAWTDAMHDGTLDPAMAQAIATTMPAEYLGVGASVRNRQAEAGQKEKNKAQAQGFISPANTLSYLGAPRTELEKAAAGDPELRKRISSAAGGLLRAKDDNPYRLLSTKEVVDLARVKTRLVEAQLKDAAKSQRFSPGSEDEKSERRAIMADLSGLSPSELRAEAKQYGVR